MPTQKLQPIEIVSGGHKMTVTEAASQSFKIGQPIYLVGGKATAVASNGTVVWGLALENASGVEDTENDVHVIDSNTILRGNVYHSTAASAVTAVANLGIKYALYVADNKAYVDIEDTSNDAVVIVSLDPAEVGDIYGRCKFKFIPAVLQSEAAAT